MGAHEIVGMLGFIAFGAAAIIPVLIERARDYKRLAAEFGALTEEEAQWLISQPISDDVYFEDGGYGASPEDEKHTE
ncbi:hypothetical protein AXZ77_0729 [Thioclava sp. ES.031]|uniref:hypothetical protein n=1 Tax=Thioclava sp. ES.031 TaxID=1798203 RepID=UPI000C0137A0|nr:hypothetical protein [Thioclava sp. ES.031]PFG62156.1 hypothetical protein AXZ77_0729 [Thioclava sp. ES.031]